MKFRPVASIATLWSVVLALQGCAASGPPLPLAKVDLNRLYGGWYLVATIPNRFERGLVAPYDVYSKRPDGDIREDFYVRRGGFAAPLKHFVVHDWTEAGSNDARWRVQVFWPINLPFLALYVDPDGRFALFGEDSRDLGWIYSRTPTLSDEDYKNLLQRFEAAGYRSSRFLKFIQTPDQIGRPGFWSDGVSRGSAP